MGVMFSILIPVYKVEKYIENCLDSVFNQTFQDYEVIIVDDGSPDNCGLICDKYRDMHPDKVSVIHQENTGTLAARRVAISHASGDYCVFLDSDDTMADHYLQRIKDIIDDHNVDMVIINYNKMEDNNEIYPCKPLFADGTLFTDSKEPIYLELIQSMRLNTLWTKIIKTELLKNDDTDYTEYYSKPVTEDLLQTLYPVTYAKSIIYCSEPLYNYRDNKASISNNFSLENVKNRFRLQAGYQVLKYIKLWNMSSDGIYELFYLKHINNLVDLFIGYFKKAKTFNEKRECVNIDWFSLSYPEIINYKKSKKLSFKTRIMINLIDKKSVVILWMLQKTRELF